LHQNALTFDLKRLDVFLKDLDVFKKHLDVSGNRLDVFYFVFANKKIKLEKRLHKFHEPLSY
jgi:hypothetical protein